MRVVLAVFFFYALSFGQTSEKLFECTKIFQDRKSELLVELERIDEEKQALEALKTATEELLKKKKNNLDLREEEVDKKLKEVSAKEASVKKMLEENKQTLKKLQSLKMSKIAQTVGQILAKMSPKKASKLTTLLAN